MIELKHEIQRHEAHLASLYAQREADIAELVHWEGWTLQAVADAYGLTKQRVSQVVRKHKDKMPALRVKLTPAEELRMARDAWEDAKRAQDLRCENYAMGYAEETKAFYGDESVATYEDAETRETWRLRDWHMSERQHLETA